MVKNLPAIQETQVQFLGQEDPLEKEKATHSIILAWRFPWTAQCGALQFVGSQRVWHNWSYYKFKNNTVFSWKTGMVPHSQSWSICSFYIYIFFHFLHLSLIYFSFPVGIQQRMHLEGIRNTDLKIQGQTHRNQLGIHRSPLKHPQKQRTDE